MVAYNFDEIINRKGTNCVKYDFADKLFGSEEIIPMWVADMDFRTPEFIINELKNRLGHEILAYSVLSENYYKSVISWQKRRHNFHIEKKWILHSPGVVPALAIATLAFTNPGDKIIVQTPVYFPFSTTIANNGRQILNNQLVYDNNSYSIDFEYLEKQIDSRTKMMFLCNPHNPVGRVWRKEELEKLAEICLKHNILVISDEIHADLVLPDYKHSPFANISDEVANNCITTISASKTFNISGLSSASVIIKNENLRKQFENKLDDLHIWIPNIFGAIATETAFTLGDEWLLQLINYLQDNYIFLKNYIENNISQIKVLPLEGTYLAWLDCSEFKMTDKELHNFFVKKAKLGISIGNQFGKGGENFVRMNIACPKSVLEKALENLKIALAK